MDVLKSVLKKEREYARYAREYLVLEAKMWFAIVDHWAAIPRESDMKPAENEMGVEYDGEDGAQFLSQLTIKEHRIFFFVRDLSEEERELLLVGCRNGRSIDAQRLDAGAVKARGEEIDQYARIAKNIVEISLSR